jgi:hypothetical protein
MAAMMGSMLASSCQYEQDLSEMKMYHEMLRGTGGALTVSKACELLCMDQEELQDRLFDKSVLWISMQGYIYIPAFQFHGKYHIKNFHDLWDVLSKSHSNEDVCRFFCQERITGSDACIRDLLMSDIDVDQLDEINLKALAFDIHF